MALVDKTEFISGTTSITNVIKDNGATGTTKTRGSQFRTLMRNLVDSIPFIGGDGLIYPQYLPLGTGSTQAAYGSHTHDGRYYTVSEADARYYTTGQIDGLFYTKPHIDSYIPKLSSSGGTINPNYIPFGTGATQTAAGNHTHDGRYYTIDQSDTLFYTKTAIDDAKIDRSIFGGKGELLVGLADNTPAVLTGGTDGQLLTKDSTATTGVKWSTVSTGGFTGATRQTYSQSDYGQYGYAATTTPVRLPNKASHLINFNVTSDFKDEYRKMRVIPNTGHTFGDVIRLYYDSSYPRRDVYVESEYLPDYTSQGNIIPVGCGEDAVFLNVQMSADNPQMGENKWMKISPAVYSHAFSAFTVTHTQGTETNFTPTVAIMEWLITRPATVIEVDIITTIPYSAFDSTDNYTTVYIQRKFCSDAACNGTSQTTFTQVNISDGGIYGYNDHTRKIPSISSKFANKTMHRSATYSTEVMWTGQNVLYPSICISSGTPSGTYTYYVTLYYTC